MLRMSINNREEANKYYQLVNELVDDYIDKWKIRPSNLKRYLKPGSERFNKFILRNNLSEVVGINRVINDVIEDRVSMEKDGVMAFESFKYFESSDFKIDSLKQTLYKGIEKSDINMEKVLADYFDTNLSDIDVIDSDKHLFKVSGWSDEDIKVIIYTEEDLEVITNNIFEHLYDELVKKEVEITENIKISLNKLIDKDKFNEQFSDIFDEKKIIKTISDLLSSEWKEKTNKYHIWVVNM
jgi:hypothetical protein